jgi:hypothetical protein
MSASHSKFMILPTLSCLLPLNYFLPPILLCNYIFSKKGNPKQDTAMGSEQRTIWDSLRIPFYLHSDLWQNHLEILSLVPEMLNNKGDRSLLFQLQILSSPKNQPVISPMYISLNLLEMI